MVVNNPVKFGYPIDNSQSICLTNPNITEPRLAGDYRTGAKLVQIISKPYNVYIDGWGHKAEFINVLYEGNKYRVLNYISNKPRDFKGFDY